MATNFRSLRSSSKSTKTKTRRLAGESLEGRSLLAADALAVSAQYGDANLDGVFNSADLIQVFQAGKYETSEEAVWSNGDWNFDGLFDSQDLIMALQKGAYGRDATTTATSVRFKGVVEAAEISVVQFPKLLVDASGSGNATHLGSYGVNYQVEVDLFTFVGIGSAQFVAANGDKLFTDLVGQGTDPTVNPISSIVETHTITGGTGRFKSASGSFTLNRVLDTTTGVTSGSFDGTIVIPRGQ